MQRKWISSLLAVVLTLVALVALPAPRVSAACVNNASTLFRSAATGNWNANATWECSDDGSVWQAATTTPTSSHGAITIRNGHTVTVSAIVTVDQVTVESGGQVTIASTITWTLADGTGTDLTVNGTVLNQGGTWTTTGTWTVSAGGTYIHNTTSGVSTPLGKATLDAGSNFVYRGSSTLTPAVSMSGRTYGNLSFESTSGSWTASPTGGGALTVNGNFVVGTSVTIVTTQTGVMTFAGDFTVNGTLTNSTGTQVYTFTGIGKTIAGSGSMTFETWNINAGASITLDRNVGIASGFIGTINGTLNTGSNVVSDSGTFTLASGATLGIGSADGITSSGATGNIQTTTRTFNTGANYTYNGASAQVTGSGLPDTVNNLTINNSAGVSLSGPTTINGTLTLTNGLLTLGANNLTMGTAASVSGTPGASNMVVAEGAGEMRKQFSATGSFTFPIGDSTPDYSPAAFTVNSAGNLGSSPYIGVRVTDLQHPNMSAGAANYISRYWSVSSTLTSPNYDATCTFIAGPGDVTGATASMSGKKWDGAAPWTTLGAATATTFAGTGLTSFSDFTAFDTPLAAALSSFDATSYGDHILVTWETVSEIGNLGFNLWRGVSPNAPDVQLNASLIPSQAPGSSQGFSYAWPDSANLVNNTTYYYWLEDVDIAGVVTRHGPISATYSAPTAVSLSGFAPVSALPVAWPLAAAGLTALAAAAVAWRRR